MARARRGMNALAAASCRLTGSTLASSLLFAAAVPRMHIKQSNKADAPWPTAAPHCTPMPHGVHPLEINMAHKFIRPLCVLLTALAALAGTHHKAHAFVIFDSKAKPPSAADTNANAVPAFMAIAASHGVYYHNSDSGHVSYCSTTSDPATRQASGACEAIGAIDKSSAGFNYSVAGNAVFIVNKSTGAIIQCSAEFPSTEKIKGSCQQRAVLQAL